MSASNIPNSSSSNSPLLPHEPTEWSHLIMQTIITEADYEGANSERRRLHSEILANFGAPALSTSPELLKQNAIVAVHFQRRAAALEAIKHYKSTHLPPPAPSTTGQVQRTGNPAAASHSGIEQYAPSTTAVQLEHVDPVIAKLIKTMEDLNLNPHDPQVLQLLPPLKALNLDEDTRNEDSDVDMQ